MEKRKPTAKPKKKVVKKGAKPKGKVKAKGRIVVKSGEVKLTAKQLKFCNEYLVDLDGAKAAVRCGYSKNAAKQIASENLTKPYLQQKIADLQLQLRLKTRITPEMVIEEYAKVGFSDVRAFIGNGNGVINIKTLDNSITASLSSVKTTVKADGSVVTDVRLHDKVKALDSIGKHLGIFREDNTQKSIVIEAKMSDEDAARITKMILDKI